MDKPYAPLPGPDYIRLLDVDVRKSWCGSQVICDFRTVPLDDLPEYTAISYCWGGQAEVARLQFSDGRHSLPLSQTLSDLFASLQKRSAKFTIWIDALCINQKDLEEKAAQVRRIGAVFSSAREVLLWLGGSDEVSRDAFRVMRSKESDPALLESVFLLLARPWFRRVWVIQEIAVARRVVVGCGGDRVGFNRFSHCVNAVWVFFEGLGNLEDDTANRGLWSVTRLIQIRLQYRKHREVAYESLLEAAFHCEATDKRDMVFAFRGIADSRPVPQPDYTVLEEEIYIATARALLCGGDSLDLLALCGIGSERSPSLPSWAPDLRYHSYAEPLSSCNRAGWDFGGPLQKPPRIESSLRLRLQAKLLDVVDVTCPPFDSLSVVDQQAAVSAIEALRLRLPNHVSKEEWVDRLVPALVFGLDIDDIPLDEQTTCRYHDSFVEWFQWLRSSSSQQDLNKIAHNEYHRTIGPRLDDWMAFMTRRHSFFCSK